MPGMGSSNRLYSNAPNVLLRSPKTASTHPDVEAFLKARLTPRHVPLIFQVQLATGHPMRLCRSPDRQGAVPCNESHPDSYQVALKTRADAISRVEQTLVSLAKAKPADTEARAHATPLLIQVGPDADGPHALRDISAVEPDNGERDS
ncbi:hypothetical protein BDW75DRAFT_238967 [Aspergillus navahoensis]